MIRIKSGPGFLRTLFSRRSKRGRNGKLAKGCSSTHSNDDVVSMHSTGTKRTMIMVDKEFEILGLVTDPRIPPVPTSQHENRVYHSAPQPSSTTSTIVNPIPRQPSDPYLRPQPRLQTHSCETLPVQRYEPLTPTSPLLPPPPSLWLPVQRPLPVRPTSERGTGPTRLDAEPEPYMDNSPTPLSPSPSHLTFATRSSGVFPCGFEPYAVDDAPGPVADWKSEDTVLVLPSPPRVVRAYGYAR
ncbi:hypothetical protein BJX64DRAFT_248268 [Aspergillus heterothallicus]